VERTETVIAAAVKHEFVPQAAGAAITESEKQASSSSVLEDKTAATSVTFSGIAAVDSRAAVRRINHPTNTSSSAPPGQGRDT